MGTCRAPPSFSTAAHVSSMAPPQLSLEGGANDIAIWQGCLPRQQAPLATSCATKKGQAPSCTSDHLLSPRAPRATWLVLFGLPRSQQGSVTVETMTIVLKCARRAPVGRACASRGMARPAPRPRRACPPAQAEERVGSVVAVSVKHYSMTSLAPEHSGVV